MRIKHKHRADTEARDTARGALALGGAVIAVYLGFAYGLPAVAHADDYGPYRPGACPGAVPWTDTGVVCAAHGWTIRQRISIGPAGWVRWTRLPACLTDEAEGGPCVWDAQRQGNHEGQSFWLDRKDRVHYVAGVA